MLTIKNIHKDVKHASTTVHILKDISLTFQKTGYVTVFGQSGCGKSTLLRIIGGLEKYTNGDILLHHKSAKDFHDKEWDAYRSYHIGFVFQNDNLIPYQSVLYNVGYVLIVSGMCKQEWQKRAYEALERVGLKNCAYFKASELNAVQRQQVAIAKALANHPDVILADEPTGDLDTKATYMIMDLLHSLANEHLVIVATHNQVLSEKYVGRVLHMQDGKIIEDSAPYEEATDIVIASNARVKRFTLMPLKDVILFSYGSLKTKKLHTFFISVAYSLGIIGIALILSLSHGTQAYIAKTQKLLLPDYPLTVENKTVDMDKLQMIFTPQETKEKASEDMIVANRVMERYLSTLSNIFTTNNTEVFKAYVDQNLERFQACTKAIEYEYPFMGNVYNKSNAVGVIQVYPNQFANSIGLAQGFDVVQSLTPDVMKPEYEVWHRLPESEELRTETFTLMAGSWPQKYNELLVVTDENGMVSDFTLYSLGLINQMPITENIQRFNHHEGIQATKQKQYTAEQFMNITLSLIPQNEFYKKMGDIWVNMEKDTAFTQGLMQKAEDLHIVGVVRQKKRMPLQQHVSGVYYTTDLQVYMTKKAMSSTIVKEQQKNATLNIFTGTKFNNQVQLTMENLNEAQKKLFATLSKSDVSRYLQEYNKNSNATFDSNLLKLGFIDEGKPESVQFYIQTMDDKAALDDAIADFNKLQREKRKAFYMVAYQDPIGWMLEGVSSSVKNVKSISLLLVSIACITGCFMMGLYIHNAIHRRMREIIVLRCAGGGKRDVLRVFVVEAGIVAMFASIIGVGVTAILNLPLSSMVHHTTKLPIYAILPFAETLLLITCSVLFAMGMGWISYIYSIRKAP